MALSDRYERFVEEYLDDLDPAAAYIRAGFKSRGQDAVKNAHRLLQKPAVREAIIAAKRERLSQIGLNPAGVLHRLKCNVHVDFRKLYHPDGRAKLPHEIDDDTAKAVASWETETEVRRGDGDEPRYEVRTTKIRLSDNLKAIAQAMQHLGIENKLTLEAILAVLDEDHKPTADRLRQLLAEEVPEGSGGDSGDGSGD